MDLRIQVLAAYSTHSTRSLFWTPHHNHQKNHPSSSSHPHGKFKFTESIESCCDIRQISATLNKSQQKRTELHTPSGSCRTVLDPKQTQTKHSEEEVKEATKHSIRYCLAKAIHQSVRERERERKHTRDAAQGFRQKKTTIIVCTKE